MAVTETLRALGGWQLRLTGVPQQVIDAMQYFGHITVHTGHLTLNQLDDSLLTSSRYTGVLRYKQNDGGVVDIRGCGMALWLGDEDKKGAVIEDLMKIENESFEDTIRAILTGTGTSSVTEGTLFNIGETYTGSFQFQSPREALDYVCDTLGADWYVTGDARLMAGRSEDLFVTEPRAALVRRQAGGDMTMRGLSGKFQTTQDVEDFTTRVVLLAQGDGASVATGSADIDPGLNPYRDLHGNPVVFTRLVSESQTDPSNAHARAQLQLNRFTGTRDAVTLSTGEYDLKGDVNVGDYLWVYDPDTQLIDSTNEVVFRGVRMNPMRLRLIELTWPVTSTHSVAYRDWAGQWYDLSPYLVAESGDNTLVIGGYNRSLTSGTSSDGGVGGSRPQPNTTVPGVPTWVVPFPMSVYQSPVNGETKAQVQLHWTRPDNTDGTTIMDGDHYDIRYRSASTPLFPVRWADLAGYRWGDLKAAGATWANPIQYPTGPWNYATAPWTELAYLLQELAPSMPYEVQIRAVDGATPSNYGDWSTVEAFQTYGDTYPPATPAPPEIASSLIAVQVTHRLGRADGGEFNLDLDLHHFEIHGEYEPNFQPSDTTRLGRLAANAGMLTGQVPAVGTFQIESTAPVYFKVIAVDSAGNKSSASSAVESTATLIDDAHISDLTVSKVTAGFIQSDWLISPNIASGATGARIEIGTDGIKAFDVDNEQTLNADCATGNIDVVGQVSSGVDGTRIILNERVGAAPVPEMRMYPSSGSSAAFINAINTAGTAGIGVNSGSNDGVHQMTVYLHPDNIWMGYMTKGSPFPVLGGFGVMDANAGEIGFQNPDGRYASFKADSNQRLIMRGLLASPGAVGANAGLAGGGLTLERFTLGSVSFGVTLAGAYSLVCTWASHVNVADDQNASYSYNKTATGFSVGTQWQSSGSDGRVGWLIFRQ